MKNQNKSRNTRKTDKWKDRHIPPLYMDYLGVNIMPPRLSLNEGIWSFCVIELLCKKKIAPSLPTPPLLQHLPACDSYLLFLELTTMDIFLYLRLAQLLFLKC
jgi:hypothetical protein